MILEQNKTTTNGVVIENILHDSSNVIKTSYNYATNQLYVTFKKGVVYNYNAVSTSLYEGMKNADSVGTYINQVIKPSHTVVNTGTASSEILNEMVGKITKYKTPNARD